MFLKACINLFGMIWIASAVLIFGYSWVCARDRGVAVPRRCYGIGSGTGISCSAYLANIASEYMVLSQVNAAAPAKPSEAITASPASLPDGPTTIRIETAFLEVHPPVRSQTLHSSGGDQNTPAARTIKSLAEKIVDAFQLIEL